MDLTEKLFELGMRWRQRRQQREIELCQYTLSECEKALALVVQPFFVEPIEIHAARQIGTAGRAFYLPDAISFFPEKSRNRDLYLHQALYLAAAQTLKVFWPEKSSGDYENALHFVKHRQSLHELIIQMYPSFETFHQELMRDFYQNLKKPASRPAQKIIDIFNREIVAEVSLECGVLKRNEPFPQELWLLWGGLGSRSFNGTRREGAPPMRKRTSPESEMQMQTHFEKEEVDLEKEQNNPVTHSFEKMESVDEYQGGRRVADGSDQLQEHGAALQEITPRKVTRSGEEAASFFKSDFSQGGQNEVTLQEPLATVEVRSYPEWHFKKKNYLPAYCRLFIETPSGQDDSRLKSDLRERYGALIARCRQQLDEVCNQRKWRNGQLDGSEIDVDAFVRHLSDVKNKVPASGRLYLNQFRRSRDLQILILLDLSLSTDSYVENRRVLDVELESVGLWGLLEEQLQDNTIVAGTYSETRHRCVFEVLKNENESWHHYFTRAKDTVPRGYTRLGPAIRHATEILRKSPAQQKILLILTDGKPTDYDGYEGRYGIEDIRKACLEAESLQIRTKAFAIEKAAKHYFPQMFFSFEILSDPQKLPESLIKTLIKLRR